MMVAATGETGSADHTLGMERLQEHRAVRAGELRAPLDSMIAYLDLLLEEDLSEREARHVIEVIHGSATRLRQMVQDADSPIS